MPGPEVIWWRRPYSLDLIWPDDDKKLLPPGHLIFGKGIFVFQISKIMKDADFVYKGPGSLKNEGKVTWTAPSNIALVKYWGKKGLQLPANPSLSLSLSTSATTTELSYWPNESSDEEVSFDLFFDGSPKPSFRPKVADFFKRILPYVPFIKDYHLQIKTSNTFPHSSGIASSASGMGALALCVMSLEKELSGLEDEDYFLKKASFLARLGSGSACRSIEGPVVVWGEHPEYPGSNDLYGVRFAGGIHPIFETYRDSILLVDKGQKKVSSTLGHNLMNGHPYGESRFTHANQNMSRMRDIMRNGDLPEFVQLVESEALTLHAMMLTSNPYFLLMRPNTLHIIESLFEFRQDTGYQVSFTLDAGANVHLLYPNEIRSEVEDFIASHLRAFCEQGQFLLDRVGSGAELKSENS